MSYRLALILALIFSESIVLGQDSLHLNMDNMFSLRSDTVYFEDGNINYITFYPSTSFTMGSFLLTDFEMQRKILQFDKCGNLRNVTEISRYTGPISSCQNYYFNHPYATKEKIIFGVECDKPWIKALVF